LCGALNARQKSETEHLKDKISDFLSHSYADSSLTLYDVSVYMGIPERALYDLIKVYFNTSFAKMLESIRIQKACELMRTGAVSIKSVARDVGYASDNTFRTAFKRMMNMTPGEFLLSI
jgi:AraC-like DNA-binding protein